MLRVKPYNQAGMWMDGDLQIGDKSERGRDTGRLEGGSWQSYVFS